MHAPQTADADLITADDLAKAFKSACDDTGAYVDCADLSSAILDGRFDLHRIAAAFSAIRSVPECDAFAAGVETERRRALSVDMALLMGDGSPPIKGILG